MITRIGIVSGDIWHYLDRDGKFTVEMMVKDLKHDKNLILMSLGWLAREGHVLLVEKGNSFEVSLRDRV